MVIEEFEVSMKEKTLFKMGTILIFLGFLGITPVIAAVDPGLTGKSIGPFGKTDTFGSDKLSVLSELKITSSYGKPAVVSENSQSFKPTTIISSLKDFPIEWDPEFMYYAHRYAHRIPRCNLG